MAKIGPREAELRRMREARANQEPSKPVMGFDMPTEPKPRPRRFAFPASGAAIKEIHAIMKNPTSKTVKKTVKKTTKKKAVAKRKTVKKPKASASRKPEGRGVPAQKIADFICRPASIKNPLGGASMAELVAEFGIESHPMRSKIYYVRHTLGYNVENRGGRYYGTEPTTAE